MRVACRFRRPPSRGKTSTMPVERVPIDATRMELLANYLLRCPAAEKFYNDQDFAWLGTAGSQATAEQRLPRTRSI
jgi:hypothetical protein